MTQAHSLLLQEATKGEDQNLLFTFSCKKNDKPQELLSNMPLPLAEEDLELQITESWEGILCIFPYSMAMISYSSLSTSCALSAHSGEVNVALSLFHSFISHFSFYFILLKRIF